MQPSPEPAPPKTPSLPEIAAAFAVIGLTSVGGANGPLRHMLVKRKHWLTDLEFAELLGLGQALPGSVAVNAGVLLTDRFVPLLGPLAALAGMVIPSFVVALALMRIANALAAVSPRFVSAEIGVTAALGGVFIANGIRVLAALWREEPDPGALGRSARLAIGALGVILVAVAHVFVPLAMAVLIALSFALETRLRGRVRGA